MGRTLKIAGAALNQTPIDWDNNLNNISSAILEAQQQNIELLCFNELTITGYGCEDLFLSDWIPKKALQILDEIIPLCHNITVCVGLPIRLNNKVYNCVAVIQNKKLLGFTAKQNLPSDGVHYEYRWFTPWPQDAIQSFEYSGNNYDIGDVIYNINGVKTGFEICEDAWVNDRPACNLIERDVELILNLSASHFSFGKPENRKILFTESSKKFNCTYLFVNLLGNEAGKMIYDGQILIAKEGELLATNELLSFNSYSLVATTVDFEDDNSNQSQISGLSKNEEFAKAASLGLYDYLRKSKSKGFVISLSGGADSATCTILVAHMIKTGINTLGANRFLKAIGRTDIEITDDLSIEATEKKITAQLLTCAYQGTINSSSTTFNAAKKLSESLGATFHHWTIDEAVSIYTEKIENALGRKLSWEKDDLSLQNIQARSRSPIIWMLTNIENKLLITTSNRSEGDVGYATMDGDTSGSIAPIAGVDKPFIREWLVWAEQKLGYTGLNLVNQQAPTAELRPSEHTQTDEDDLMPYTIMVEIEKLAIGNHQSPIEVFNKLKDKNLTSSQQLVQYIQKFYRLWSRNQWKRERTAPAFHLDDFSVDPKSWCRFPILSGNFEEELKELLTI
ncbi:MAG: NAD(+) synthase [Cyclobacteriaceae bacterium]|nr:NAD(+) synthase [Cyclobacteriaceae bacterium]